jgi:hypothetical protein
MTDDAAGALLELASSIVDEVAAVRIALVAAGQHDPARPRQLTPGQLALAEAANPPEYQRRPGPSAVVPLVKAEKSCGYCGNPDASQLTGGDDQRYGFEDDWICSPEHERSCISRRERRWPPRPDLVDPVLMSAVGDADAAQAARQQLQQQASVAAESVARQQWHPPGWQVTEHGSWDEFGTWRPNLPPARPLVPFVQPHADLASVHTLQNKVNRSHLLSGQARPHYYAGAGHIPLALYGSDGHEEAPGGQPGPDVPDGSLRPVGDHYAAARGAVETPGADLQVQQPAHPDALPARPARRRSRAPQYGRRTRR